MTKYASSDITGHFNAQCPKGGHRRKVLNQREVNKGGDPIFEEDPVVGNHLVVNCPVCEPGLLGKDSWSSDPLNIPLTPKEQAEAAKQEKDGLKASALMAEALAELAHERISAR